jgi:protein ImuA
VNFSILMFYTVSEKSLMSASLQRIVNAESPLSAGKSLPFNEAQLPSTVSHSIWRGTEVGQTENAVIASGFEKLDKELPGGGWPCNAITEVLQPQPSLCEWRLLSPALSGIVSAGGQILLVGPPKRPHAPGLQKLGITEKNLVWIAAETPAERLWTTEQLVKANPHGGAILAWLPQARAEQLRRLQVHAQSCDCPVFLFRPESAQIDASPAPLRVLVTLGMDWELKVQILKRKGAIHEDAISLPSIPGTLASVFPPRLLRPSELIAKSMEHTNVSTLGSATNRRRLRQLTAH